VVLLINIAARGLQRYMQDIEMLNKTQLTLCRCLK